MKGYWSMRVNVQDEVSYGEYAKKAKHLSKNLEENTMLGVENLKL